jgi:hypothetical protein
VDHSNDFGSKNKLQLATPRLPPEVQQQGIRTRAGKDLGNLELPTPTSTDVRESPSNPHMPLNSMSEDHRIRSLTFARK